MGKIPLRQRVAQFMWGRNGPDALYNFSLIVCIVLVVINIFVGSIIISVLEYALFIWTIWRCFSRNAVKRRAENMRFLKIKGKVTKWFDLIKCRFRDRKTHVYRKCPHCKNNLRLPKKKGDHTVKCPVCRGSFDVHI